MPREFFAQKIQPRGTSRAASVLHFSAGDRFIFFERLGHAIADDSHAPASRQSAQWKPAVRRARAWRFTDRRCQGRPDQQRHCPAPANAPASRRSAHSRSAAVAIAIPATGATARSLLQLWRQQPFRGVRRPRFTQAWRTQTNSHAIACRVGYLSGPYLIPVRNASPARTVITAANVTSAASEPATADNSAMPITGSELPAKQTTR